MRAEFLKLTFLKNHGSHRYMYHPFFSMDYLIMTFKWQCTDDSWTSFHHDYMLNLFKEGAAKDGILQITLKTRFLRLLSLRN